jgi:hypothetical protein
MLGDRQGNRLAIDACLRQGCLASSAEYGPTTYHYKVIDLLVSLGSTNFDNRSFRLNGRRFPRAVRRLGGSAVQRFRPVDPSRRASAVGHLPDIRPSRQPGEHGRVSRHSRPVALMSPRAATQRGRPPIHWEPTLGAIAESAWRSGPRGRPLDMLGLGAPPRRISSPSEIDPSVPAS